MLAAKLLKRVPGPKKIFFEDRPPPPPPLSQALDPALNIVSRSSIC